MNQKAWAKMAEATLIIFGFVLLNHDLMNACPICFRLSTFYLSNAPDISLTKIRPRNMQHQWLQPHIFALVYTPGSNSARSSCKISLEATDIHAPCCMCFMLMPKLSPPAEERKTPAGALPDRVWEHVGLTAHVFLFFYKGGANGFK